jgi:hypothetical protein
MAAKWRTLLIVAVPVILVVNGVVHGVLTFRWVDKDLAMPAEKAAALPMVIGAWDGTTIDMESSPYPREMIVPSVARRYVSRTNGAAVTVLLTWGHTGPLALHTPRECYGGLGYKYTPPYRHHSAIAGSDQTAAFWVALFSKADTPTPEHLRIFWAWNATGRWEAADSPRLAFAGQRALYRLYVIRQLARPEEPLDSDPSLEFIPLLLQALENTL